MKEATGGDNLAIGWTNPGTSTINVIGSRNIANYTDDIEGPSAHFFLKLNIYYK